ncbi:MAG: S8 family peptidase, partial [Gammaproteobacteria bacterium]|nr:S8 family peptidase [Gammaproteobacteria bacterium]
MSTRAYLATLVIALLLVLVVGGDGIERHTGSKDGASQRLEANNEALQGALARNRAASERRLSASVPQAQAAAVAAVAFTGDGVSGSPQPASGGKFQKMPRSNRSPDGLAKARERSSERSLSTDGLGTPAADGRDWSFAWIRVDPGAAASTLRAELSRLGVEVLRASGEHLLVRTPRTRDVLEAVSELAGIAGFGGPRPEQKIADRLTTMVSTGVVGDELPVMITLVTEDDGGVWRESLEAKGVVVGDWHGDIRTYAANIDAGMLRTVAALDFVAAIEPIEVVHATLESSVAVMGADGLRRFDEATGEFSGTTGASVAVGIVDTGLNTNHRDMSVGRASVCGRNFFRDAEEGDEDVDMWFDYYGHGTHVAGILAGAGAGDSSRSGIAPGVRHIRAAKALSRSGSGDTTTVANAIGYLQSESACAWEGDESAPVKPLVVNLSLGSQGESNGRGAMSRKLDAAAWNSTQLLVLAAGNAGSSGVSPESASKNALSVGAVTDPGVVASFSSHGPTADGRLAPHVVGAGFDVTSARGSGKGDGYVNASGTSMAAPAVAGVAALLMDHDPDFRGRPEYTRARLMASAVKPSAVIGPELGINLDNSEGPGEWQHEYGLGLVSARTAAAGGDDEAWTNDGDFLSVAADASYYVDIEVPANAARLDIVLSWIEPPTDSIASKTVLADLDLYLDVGADCADEACGEYASKSPVDNVEWLILKDPSAGTHRLKVVPASDFAGSVRAGVAWTVIRDADTPTLALSTEQPVVEVDAGSAFEIDLRLGADHYVAAGTTIHLACEGGFEVCSRYADAGWWPVSEADREDGTTARIEGGIANAIPVGEVWSGEEQRVALVVPKRVATESHVLHFVASSWNATADVLSVDVVVDSTDPEPAAARPANDGIDDAVEIADGDRVEFALALATREPGEPMVRDDRGATSIKKFFSEYGPNDYHHPEPNRYATHKSVWYAFHATVAGPVHLSWGFEGFWEDSEAHLSVYEGDAPTDSRRIADAQWEDHPRVDFVADAETTYLVQLWTTSFDSPAGFLAVGRTPDVAPPNDDFADRIELVGESGTVDGSNYRGTLEAFEYYGETDAVSTWYTWTAAESGWWEVTYPSGFHVLVFEGSTTAGLRRVSDMPADSREAIFSAKEGTQYQFAVLNTGTDTPAPIYDLHWRKAGFVWLADNDMLADAEQIEGSMGTESVARWSGSTVEPDEPLETGTGTQWWQWQAPEAGTYLFRLDQRLHESMAAFSGTGFEDFELLQSGHSITLDAEADTTYSLSVGFGPDSTYADLTDYVPGNGFSWGPVPGNDMPSSANQLVDAEGTVTSDHSFATARGEPNDIMGHSSLWWEWQAPAAGWQRFALDDWESMGLDYAEQQAIIAVYTTTDDGELDFVAGSDHSYVANGRAEAIFLAEEGVAYVVRVALRATDLGSWSRETTFSYAAVDPPAWQRYVGSVVEAG